MKVFAVVSVSLALFILPAVAENSELCRQNPQNTKCEVSKSTVNSYPVLDRNIDWRTEQSLPWSTPVNVKDPFDGEYLAVFDRNFSGNITFGGSESGVVSNWSRKYIRIYAYEARVVSGFFTSSRTNTVLETKSLEIKLGDLIFRLQGEDGNYVVTEELAKAMAQAPEEVTKTRITVKGSGQTIINDIGIETVKSWRTVYAK